MAATTSAPKTKTPPTAKQKAARKDKRQTAKVVNKGLVMAAKKTAAMKARKSGTSVKEAKRVAAQTVRMTIMMAKQAKKMAAKAMKAKGRRR